MKQQEHVVIGRGLVQPEPTAAGTAVDQHPTAFTAHGDCDRLHAAGAVGLAVAGHVAVKMTGPQATRAVVAVRGAGGVERDVYAAVAARERTRKRQVW